jgi:Tfp pilus assembly protein PilN
MRPVNLIPVDEQRGASAALRTGSLIYVLLGGLALLLLAIVAVALTGKQVSDRKSEKAGLEQELQQETARANSLAAFATFRAVQASRAATVTSLAQSRFDWTRVLQELALVLPEDVSLSSLTGSVSPEVNLDAGSGSSGGGGSEGTDLRGSIAGPALVIDGCAPSQDSVAGFVSALEDIDGVTRVGLSSSEASNSDTGSDAASTGSTGGAAQCVAGPKTFNFKITVAFDAVPPPPTATTAPSVPASVAPASTGNDRGVAEAQTQENVARASTREQTTQAQNAQSTLIPGG